MRRFWWVPLALLAFFLLVQPRGAGHANLPSPTPAQESAAPEVMATTNALVIPTTASPLPPEEAAPATPTRSVRPTPQATSTPEPAVLAPDVAPPTPAAEPTAPLQASQPVRLIIPEIGLDTAPVAVGLDERRVPIVPRHDVGWFTGGALPGQGSNVVFWGHVLRWKDAPDIPAPFARVHELQPGAEFIVVTADGAEHRYRIIQQVQVRPEEVQYIYPTSRERVTLVSCIGDKVILDGTLTKEFRLVTIAEPVSENQPASSDDGAG